MAKGKDMKITWKGIFLLLAVTFVIVFIWTDPRGAGAALGPFLADVGHFLAAFFQKTSEFLSSL
jgi:hypothetical protein